MTPEEMRAMGHAVEMSGHQHEGSQDTRVLMFGLASMIYGMAEICTRLDRLIEQREEEKN